MNSQIEGDQDRSISRQTQDDPSRSFRLRAEHPRVTRLSRKVLAGGIAVALVVIGGAVLWSLQNNRSRNQPADELYATEHHDIADGIATLPKDYMGLTRQGIPQLGPPSWRPWASYSGRPRSVADDWGYGSRCGTAAPGSRNRSGPRKPFVRFGQCKRCAPACCRGPGWRPECFINFGHQWRRGSFAGWSGQEARIRQCIR